MNEYNYGTMDDSSSYYYSDDLNDNHGELKLMQQQEANDFADYDQAMYDACYYDNQEQHEEYGNDSYQDDDDDAIMWDDQQDVYYYDDDLQDYDDEEYEEENHDDSALLRLIVGVQMYLGETATVDRSKDDTTLMDLQYKMYTYMKQRAFELGMDTSSLY